MEFIITSPFCPQVIFCFFIDYRDAESFAQLVRGKCSVNNVRKILKPVSDALKIAIATGD